MGTKKCKTAHLQYLKPVCIPQPPEDVQVEAQIVDDSGNAGKDQIAFGTPLFRV